MFLQKKNRNKHSLHFKKGDANKLISTNSPFAIKEAYITTRTNLMFTNKDDESCPVYVVTSALPNDGKSINCVNLALTFAQMEKKILIIDMDMRNPTIHQLLGVPLEHGVSEILAGLEKNVYIKGTEHNNLNVISAGRIPPNPAELLSGKKVDILLSEAQERFDYIFIDTPPVEVVSDAAIVAKKVTGLILVVRNGLTDISVVKHSINTLEQVAAPVVGFLLNDVNPKNQSIHKGYKYRYHYYNSDYDYSSKR
jgi:capsular exopolysaccharide synthesis family protein